MIAAHALEPGVTLVTHNLRHFNLVEGLEIEDWVYARKAAASRSKVSARSAAVRPAGSARGVSAA